MLKRLLAMAFCCTSIACGSTRSAPPTAPSSSATKSAFATSADGVSIHYVDEGHGQVVVLSHCLGCNLHYWDAAARDLARDHRVVRLDLAGHGTSGSNREHWTIESFAGDIRAVVAATGVDRFTLVGHSMSGTVALETAVELGDQVRGVVPIDSVIDVDARLAPEERAAVLEQARSDFHGFLSRQLQHLLPNNPDPAVVARIEADADGEDPARTIAILDSLFSYREDRALDRLSVPIVAVDSDRRPLALDHNRAHAPQFDARVLKNTGHWLMLDEPDAFVRALRKVIESVENGTAARRPG